MMTHCNTNLYSQTLIPHIHNIAKMNNLKWPENVGICGIELYTPRLYVDQSDLEVFDNESVGKYTIGLGQQQMSFFIYI
jgi:hypothetical protein